MPARTRRGSTRTVGAALAALAIVLTLAIPASAANPSQSVTVTHSAAGCTITVTITWVGFPGGKDTAEVHLVIDGYGYGSRTSTTTVRGHGGTFSGDLVLTSDGSVHNIYGWGQLLDNKGNAIAGSVGQSIVSGAYCKG